MENIICKNYETNVLPTLHNDVAPEYRGLLLAYAIALFIFTIVGFFAFILTKSKVIYSKQKNTLSSFACLIGMLCEIIVYVYREYYGRDRFPCIALALMFHLPMIFFASQQMGTVYLYMYKLRQERMKTSNVKKMFNEDVDVQSQSSLEQTGNTPMSFFKTQRNSSTTIINLIVDFLFVWRYSKNGRIIVPGEDQSQDPHHHNDNTGATKIVMDVVPSSSPQKSRQTTDVSGSHGAHSTKQYWMEQVGMPMLVMILFGFPYPIAIALRIHLDPIYNAGCVGCRLTYVDYLLKLTCGCIYIVMAVIGLYCMRNEHDPLRIFKELRLGLMWGVVIMTTWIVNIVSSFKGVHDIAIANMADMIATAGVFYAFVLSGVVITMFEQKRWNLLRDPTIPKATATVASISTRKEYSEKNLPPPSALDFNMILLEPKARNAFLEHAINELSSENLVFVFKLRAWKAMWEKEKPEKVTKIAIQLFKEYISKDSKAPINIPQRLYVGLEKDIEPFLGNVPRSMATQTADDDIEGARRKSLFDKPKKDIFDECEKECVAMLQHGALPRFVHSELFKTQVIEAGLLPKILKQ